jgi:hypothetical protein
VHHVGEGDEALDGRRARGVGASDEHVEVADGCQVAAHAAAGLAVHYPLGLAHARHQPPRRLQRLRELDARALVAARLDGREEALLAHCPEARQAAQAAGARRLLHLEQRRELELAPDDLGGLRAQARQAQQIDEAGWHAGAALLELAQAALGDQLVHAPRDAVADARHLGQLAGGEEHLGGLAQALDGPRRVAEGAHAEARLAVHLEQIGQVGEGLDDGVVLHALARSKTARRDQPPWRSEGP